MAAQRGGGAARPPARPLPAAPPPAASPAPSQELDPRESFVPQQQQQKPQGRGAYPARDAAKLSRAERCKRGIKSTIGLSDITDGRHIWRMLLAELLGTFFLVFVGCGSTMAFNREAAPSNMHIALTFGLAVASIVQHAYGFRTNLSTTQKLQENRERCRRRQTSEKQFANYGATAFRIAVCS